MSDTPNDKPGCLSRLFPFLKKTVSQPADVPLPYCVRDDFLSPSEFSFYKVLTSLSAGRFTIQSKVRLADVFFVARPNENMSYFNRIAQRHLDFLVCDLSTMKPLFGIELDDASHQRSDRQERDGFVEKVFAAAKLPLVRVPVQREYSPRQLAELIAPYLPSPSASQPAVSVASRPLPTMAAQPAPPSAASAAAPNCPKCGIPMVLRTVSRGEHQGKQFYGCSNYPQCRVMLPLSEKGG